MSTGRPGRGSDQFIVRFPEGMREKLKINADEQGRSMNAEIVQRLLVSLKEEEFNGSYLMKVNVPENLYYELVKNSESYEYDLQEYVLDIFNREVNRSKQYETSYEAISELQLKISNASLDLKAAVDQEQQWRHIAKINSSLLISICAQIISYRNDVPANLVEMAREIISNVRSSSDVSS